MQTAKIALPGSAGAPYPALSTLLKNYGPGGNPADILAFGDSVMMRVSKDDTDERHLAQMLEDALKPSSFVALTRSAHHPAIYRGLLAALMTMPRAPKHIVLPINLRCFSPQWDANPDWQLSPELTALLTYHIHRHADLPPIPDVLQDAEAMQAYERMPVSYELSDIRTVGGFRDLVRNPAAEVQAERRKQIFIFHYTHRLATGHRRLQSLAWCAEASRLIAEPVFYLTPINVEAGARIVGSRFVDIVRANAATVKEALQRRGVIVHDWSEGLPESAFFHEDTATEHLNQSGRGWLSAKIASAVRQNGE